MVAGGGKHDEGERELLRQTTMENLPGNRGSEVAHFRLYIRPSSIATPCGV